LRAKEMVFIEHGLRLEMDEIGGEYIVKFNVKIYAPAGATAPVT
jgi:hypothetical protein